MALVLSCDVVDDLPSSPCEAVSTTASTSTWVDREDRVDGLDGVDRQEGVAAPACTGQDQEARTGLPAPSLALALPRTVEAASASTFLTRWWDRQARNSGQSSSSQSQELQEELPDYFEVKDGWPFCKLCRRHLTDGHLASKNHKYRVEMTEYETAWARDHPAGIGRILDAAQESTECQPCASPSATKDKAASAAAKLEHFGGANSDKPPESWGDPHYFEWRDGWRWYCLICRQWADGSHVNGNRHTKQVAWAESQNEHMDNLEGFWRNPNACEEAQKALKERPKPELDPWGSDWKALLSSAGDTADVSGARGHATAAGYAASCSGSVAASSQAVAPLAPGWQKIWSDAYKQDYYWNTVNDETTWDMPPWPAEWV